MFQRPVIPAGRVCFIVYLTWSVLSLLAIVLIPPYLDVPIQVAQRGA